MYLFCCCFFFFLQCSACGISVLQPRIEHVPPASRMWNLNQWTTREIPYLYILKSSIDFNENSYKKHVCEIPPIFTVVVSLSVEYSLPPYFILSILNSLREFVLGFSSRKKCLAEKLICFFLYHHNNNLNDCNS